MKKCCSFQRGIEQMELGGVFWDFLMFNNLVLTFFVSEKERACLEITCRMIIISPELISWFLTKQTVFFPCLSFPFLCFVCSEQTVSSLMQGLSGSTAFSTCSSGPGFYITTVQTLIISAFFTTNSKVRQHNRK